MNLDTRRSLHRTFAHAFIALGTLIVASAAAANANKEHPVAILTLANSPIALTKCEAWARDANKTILLAA